MVFGREPDVLNRSGGENTSREDDLVLPFQVPALGVRGRVLRSGPVVTEILARHGYPDPVARLVGEATALAAMLGTMLRISGKFLLQTRSDGPVDLLIVDFQAPDAVRAYAHYNESRLDALSGSGRASSADLLGDGHLALTIDQGGQKDRYQGIVPLGSTTLAGAAHMYFRQSEQIPTRVMLAAAPLVTPGGETQWRAGGILIQHLPAEGLSARRDLDPGDNPAGTGLAEQEENENWTKAKALLASVEDHELLDPLLAPETLLYRLYHEDRVRASAPRVLNWHCRCSRGGISKMLHEFSADDLQHMAEEGRITVTCEFCNASYRFDKAEFSGT